MIAHAKEHESAASLGIEYHVLDAEAARVPYYLFFDLMCPLTA